ncbi:MAG: hypothetical protein ACRD23_14180 [Terriglobales bacterium]
MPSLIYVTRVRPLSPDLIQGLESAGFHVMSFGPGKITADACLLVMTSEAILAGLPTSGPATTASGAASVDGGFQGTPRLRDLGEHLEPEAAIWDRIKAEAVSATLASVSAAPRVGRAAGNLGFVPSRAGLRILAGAQMATDAAQPSPAAAGFSGKNGKPAVAGPPMTSAGRVARKAEPASTLSSRDASASKKIRLAGGRHDKKLWQPAAMAAALLIVAAVLLAGRASILPPAADATTVGDTNPGRRSDSDSAGSIPGASSLASKPASQPSNLTQTSTKTPNPTAEGRRHVSDYDFVAEDYTTHFDAHSHPKPEPPELRRGANRLIQKRVVVN